VLSGDMKTDIERIVSDFGRCGDLVVSEINMAKTGVPLTIVYLKSMSDEDLVNAISEELNRISTESRRKQPDAVFQHLSNSVAAARSKSEGHDFKALYKEILDGNTVFLIDGYNRFFSIATASGEGRAIAEPTSQTIIKGPKDAFTESIDKNIYLIRSRIRNEALRVEDITLGTVTHTRVKLVYMNGIAKGDIVDDLRSRVSKIVYDGIISSGYIEEIIKTDPYSLFPTSLNSERPDKVAADLLEGRVVILCDGTPYAVIAPALFSDFLQASDDYYENFYVASLMRIVRYVALFFTLLVPAAYTALITFHHEIIPTPLLISIAAQREGVPFPAILEVLLMELTFEILREAGIRMPRAVGSAISIVGALVLGQAAVEAGLVAAVTVIVIALTAISSFAITNYAMSNSIRMLRFAFILLAGMLGLYGLSMGLIIFVLHLCKLKSASVPYLAPVAPLIKGGNKDTFIRSPLLKLIKRPAGITGTQTPRTDGQNTVDPGIKKKQELS
jgi:spore germination protein KA